MHSMYIKQHICMHFDIEVSRFNCDIILSYIVDVNIYICLHTALLSPFMARY
jgi:hypothetical protein